jgi:alpha-D-ribose 1-methylphosphonate 5-triphosphate diphosphatase
MIEVYDCRNAAMHSREGVIMPKPHDLILSNARIVTESEVFLGTLKLADGIIIGIDRGRTAVAAVDCEDDMILPGLIDAHTDHLEKHVVPRPGTLWDPRLAVLSHDAAMIAAGVTTVFDSLCAGGVGSPTRRALLAPAMTAIEAARTAGLLRADHYLHLRCDLIEREAARLIEGVLDDPRLRFVTFIDDQPERDPGRAALVHERRRGLPAGSLALPIAPLPEEDFAGAGERRRRLVTLCADRGIPTANHDDTQAVHVEEAATLGMTVAEFPISLSAARAAKANGMTVLCGAPNLVRGRSHGNNVAVADLVAAGFVDVLCSDYVPASLLRAVFRLTETPFELPLPRAVAMAATRPADLFGLHDRGRIAVGKRADLLRVRLWDGLPTLRHVWVTGREVLPPPPARSQAA